MGLDMYLTKKTYVKNWDHMKPEEQHTITIIGPMANVIKPKRITYIEEEVCYWRKANAIHKWFVDNCQDGVDDCREAWISKDKLHTLLDTVITVLDSLETILGDVHVGTAYKNGEVNELYEPGELIADTKIAEKLLPTQLGFFFGGTDYDQFYIGNLRHTRQVLQGILNEPNSGEFYYQASW